MKKIALSKGLFAIVDDDMFDDLNQYVWHATKGSVGKFYARRRCKLTDKKIYMHRQIMKATTHIDHINGDGLDNRIENLRPCTHSENLRNRPIQKNNTSGYKGVYWSKSESLWHARIKMNGKHISLGRFEYRSDAARAYDRAARKHYGEFAMLNFPWAPA